MPQAVSKKFKSLTMKSVQANIIDQANSKWTGNVRPSASIGFEPERLQQWMPLCKDRGWDLLVLGIPGSIALALADESLDPLLSPSRATRLCGRSSCLACLQRNVRALEHAELCHQRCVLVDTRTVRWMFGRLNLRFHFQRQLRGTHAKGGSSALARTYSANVSVVRCPASVRSSKGGAPQWP